MSAPSQRDVIANALIYAHLRTHRDVTGLLGPIFSRVAPGHYTEVIPTIVVTTEEREGIRARLRAWSEL